MDANPQQDDGAVAIGQQDQRREQTMQREEGQEQGVHGYGADSVAAPAEQRGVDEDSDPDGVGAEDGPADEDYHPGQARQPDRASTDGLTGTGPAQPD